MKKNNNNRSDQTIFMGNIILNSKNQRQQQQKINVRFRQFTFDTWCGVCDFIDGSVACTVK